MENIDELIENIDELIVPTFRFRYKTMSEDKERT